MSCFCADEESSFMDVDGVNEGHGVGLYFVFIEKLLQIYLFYYIFAADLPND